MSEIKPIILPDLGTFSADAGLIRMEQTSDGR